MKADVALLQSVAVKLREDAIRMVHHAKASHLGTCLSMADLLACLYWHAMKVHPEDPQWDERDRFILSKGHGAAILYAALAERGFFAKEELLTYCAAGSRLTGHATSGVPGVELSSGSLGHGLPVGCGIALAHKRAGKPNKTYVILGDGEMDEGSNWEALLFGAHHRLDNLVAIIDYNKIQSYGRTNEVLNLEPLSDKLRAFGWGVAEVDGHDMEKLTLAFDTLPFNQGKPIAMIAHTIKGKGISFMQDQLVWHYKSPSDEQLVAALNELGVNA